MKKKRQLRRKEVKLTLPEGITFGLSRARFSVFDEGIKFGELQVSQGSVVWFPRDGKLGYNMKWGKFDDVMQANGSKRRTRNPRR